ncbi:taste receptor type 2 member 3 [Elephas maximus indicus]|uniref:taste receptor type 2 member 3 n=1 Tax=Elephas maximus indicus TaxID=99487 RepID=UPI002115D6F0|nr:taste receptor type 2 member 3 [Elephas maximus indicus]
MLGLAEYVFLVLSLAQFGLGLLANGFIGLVNGSGWFKSKRISLSDFIITSLALSRIVLLWLLLVDGALIIFSPKDHDSGVVMQAIDVFWMFMNHLNIWLVTCLGVLYCLKIASFSHPAFLWLKWRVSRVVMWMLLGALLLSCSSAMSLIGEFKAYADFSRINGTGNATEHIRKKRRYKLLHVLGTLWNLPPSVVSMASYFLLILSLGRHTRQIQHMGASSRDPSTEAHKRAMKIILSFLFLFLLYFLAFLIISSSYFLPKTKTVMMTGETIAMLYLTGHSFILILGNTKLKQAFVELLRCEPGHLKPGSGGPSPHRAAEGQGGA